VKVTFGRPSRSARWKLKSAPDVRSSKPLRNEKACETLALRKCAARGEGGYFSAKPETYLGISVSSIQSTAAGSCS
jgi:hypothetical protein